eukprot:4855846-Alexandrium_andersonii.AAC.1
MPFGLSFASLLMLLALPAHLPFTHHSGLPCLAPRWLLVSGPVGSPRVLAGAGRLPRAGPARTGRP